MATRSTPPKTAPTNKKVAKAVKAGGSPAKSGRRSIDRFNVAVASVCVAGVALVAGSVYGRRVNETAPYLSTRDDATSVWDSAKIESASVKYTKAVTDGDEKKIKAATAAYEKVLADAHWHAAYGIYSCDVYIPSIDGTSLLNQGIYARNDGLIYISPTSNATTGKNARFGKFMEGAFITVDKAKVKYPKESAGLVEPKSFTTVNAANSCKKDGKTVAARVSVWKWDSAKDSTAEVYTTELSQIPLLNGGVYAIVIAPEGTKVPMPPSVSNLANPADLSAYNLGDVTASQTETTTTVAGETTTTVAGATTTVAGATTTATAATTTAAPTTTKG